MCQRGNSLTFKLPLSCSPLQAGNSTSTQPRGSRQELSLKQLQQIVADQIATPDNFIQILYRDLGVRAAPEAVGFVYSHSEASVLYSMGLLAEHEVCVQRQRRSLRSAQPSRSCSTRIPEDYYIAQIFIKSGAACTGGSHSEHWRQSVEDKG